MFQKYVLIGVSWSFDFLVIRRLLPGGALHPDTGINKRSTPPPPKKKRRNWPDVGKYYLILISSAITILNGGNHLYTGQSNIIGRLLKICLKKGFRETREKIMQDFV
jgi:hypothetical protein